MLHTELGEAAQLVCDATRRPRLLAKEWHKLCHGVDALRAKTRAKRASPAGTTLAARGAMEGYREGAWAPAIEGPTTPRPSRMRAALRAVRKRVSLLTMMAFALYAAGVFARFEYAIRFHHPRHYVTSDAIPITMLAQTLIDPSAHQQLIDTVWPPGMGSVLALNLLVDPSLSTAGWMQFVLSSLVPLLIGHAAYLVWGTRSALYALIASSLHFGFVHYAGFFLSEQLGQFAMALAVWAAVLATSQSERRWMFAAGLGAGLSWGLAFAFRPNTLPVALMIGTWLCVRWVRRRRTALLVFAGAAVGLSLVFVPLTHRCTTVLGEFCPGASNGPMNMALGHAWNDAGAAFRGEPGAPGDGFGWVPPARLHHGYAGFGEIPALFYDTGGLLAWLARRFAEDPIDFVIVSFGNALDLFGLDYWPDDYARLPARWAGVVKQLFFAGVLIPALVAWGLHLRTLLRRKPLGDVDVVLTSGVLGLVLMAALSMGEARYRMPFDAFFILLAAGLLRHEVPAQAPARWKLAMTRVAVVLLAAGSGMAALAIVAVAHPSTALAARLARSTPEDPGCRVEKRVPIAQLSHRKRSGAPRDDPTNVRLGRRRACTELRLTLQGIAHHRVLDVASDSGDRYRATFYLRGAAVGALSWGIIEDPGLRRLRPRVPRDAVRAGYDEVGIAALYGDGSYSVGHVMLAK